MIEGLNIDDSVSTEAKKKKKKKSLLTEIWATQQNQN